MGGGVDVSIVIATRDRRDHLARTLRSLEGLERGGSFEVVVADHGSSDGTADLVARSPLPAVRVPVPFRHESIADPKNAGAAAATGDVVVFLDSGMVCPPGFVRAHLATHRGRPGSFVAGEVHGWDCEQDADPYWEAIDAGRFPAVPAHFADPRVARWSACAETSWMLIWGANMSLPRRAFMDGGGFDAGMRGWGWDDIELAYRLLSRSGLRSRFSRAAWAVHYPHPRAPLEARLRSAHANWMRAYDRHRAPELETWDVCGYWEHAECLSRLRAAGAALARTAYVPPARTAADGDGVRVLFGFPVPAAPDPRDVYLVPPGAPTGAGRYVESHGLRTTLADRHGGVALASPHLLRLDWSTEPGWAPLACAVLRELDRVADRVRVVAPAGLAPAAVGRLHDLAATAAVSRFDVVDGSRASHE